MCLHLHSPQVDAKKDVHGEQVWLWKAPSPACGHREHYCGPFSCAYGWLAGSRPSCAKATHKDASMLVLFETPAGYALFKVRADDACLSAGDDAGI